MSRAEVAAKLGDAFRNGRFKLIDPVLLGATLALCALGLLMIYSITAAPLRSAAFLENQGFRIALGLVGLAIASRIDYHRWGYKAPLYFALGLLGLLLVLVPNIGHEVNGARRWIKIGSQTLQPVDFARVGLVIYLAFLLSKPRQKLEQFSSGLLPCMVAVGLMVLLLFLQPNMSSAIAITVIAGLMLLVGRIPFRHLGLLLVPAAVAIPVLGKGYQSARIENWLAYWKTGAGLDTANYQMDQSLISIGSGGLWGKGLGVSDQKWDFLPDARTDFIFAILGEELGFFGALIVIGLLLLVFWRSYQISRTAPD
ncbi:MAG: FtsW/RodA/SpoVE family cell cycle protein, partial [Candidatus Eisenbacteria bacterium]|nr:FtsW/RodA/SpoVE family cell cycle protein [Candidatus Eisenbacteria bacterium]